MLVMVVFFIAFRWIHLSTPLIRLFLLVLILLLMPTLNFLPVWFALSLLRFRLPSRLPMMFILWMVAMMVVRSEERRVGKECISTRWEVLPINRAEEIGKLQEQMATLETEGALDETQSSLGRR